MGWVHTQGATRKDIIKECTQGWTGKDGKERICLRHCTRGNVLWTVWDVGGERRFIGCDLLRNDRGFGWGNKGMDESMEPCYYTCPLAYLDMMPVVREAWREKVREYHAEQKRQRARKFTLGETVELKGVTIPWVIITSLKPLYGQYNRRTYRIPRSMLA